MCVRASDEGEVLGLKCGGQWNVASYRNIPIGYRHLSLDFEGKEKIIWR